MQVRYFKILAYVVEIHPLVMMLAFITAKVSTFMCSLYVPYCTCRATHSMQNRFAYFWLSIVVYFVILFQLDVCITITELFCENYRYIFKVLLHDITGYREFMVLHEDARIFLNQTTTQLDAYAAWVLLFAIWSSLILLFYY